MKMTVEPNTLLDVVFHIGKAQEILACGDFPALRNVGNDKMMEIYRGLSRSKNALRCIIQDAFKREADGK